MLNMKIPEEIKEEHILAAINKIDEESPPPKRQSKIYDLIYKGKKYPPKYVISLAYKFATGQELSWKQFKNNKTFRLEF